MALPKWSLPSSAELAPHQHGHDLRRGGVDRTVMTLSAILAAEDVDPLRGEYFRHGLSRYPSALLCVAGASF
jgi:hypothetical protein